MSQQLIGRKAVLAVMIMLAVIVASAAPAHTQDRAEEITVTGVISAEGTKADGTPVYGITYQTSQGEEGYLMEGDYSAYVGKRVTVHGTPESGHAERVLNVTGIE